MDLYTTIAKGVESVLYKEKGSKFVGYIYPVTSTAEANTQLAAIQSKHPKASHHCYAYRLGVNGKTYRTNDDGEPKGTAGLPIYNQLLSNKLTNVILIVVRYYGGTKLGVGGLVKAYKQTAALTIKPTNIIQEHLQTTLEFSFDYSDQIKVNQIIKQSASKIIAEQYTQHCQYKISIRQSQWQLVYKQLSQLKSFVER